MKKTGVFALRCMLAMVLILWAGPQALAGGPSTEASPCLNCGPSRSVQATVESHVTTLYSYLTECPTVPQEVTEFYAGQDVTAWNYTANCRSGDQFQFIWVAPDGTTWTGSVETLLRSSNYCFWTYWSNGIPDKPGTWQVKFYYNGTLKYTDVFTVIGGNNEWNSVYNKIFASNKNSNLKLLRQFRDEVLLDSEQGRDYVNRLYDRSHEVALLLLLNPDLLAQSRSVVDQLIPVVRDLLQGETGFLPQQLVDDLSSLLDAMHAEAGPKLQILIQDVQQFLQDQS